MPTRRSQTPKSFGSPLRWRLLTINKRDFVRLHRLQPSHAGIVVCSQDPDLPRQAEAIHEAIQALNRWLVY